MCKCEHRTFDATARKAVNPSLDNGLSVYRVLYTEYACDLVQNEFDKMDGAKAGNLKMLNTLLSLFEVIFILVASFNFTCTFICRL